MEVSEARRLRALEYYRPVVPVSGGSPCMTERAASSADPPSALRLGQRPATLVTPMKGRTRNSVDGIMKHSRNYALNMGIIQRIKCVKCWTLRRISAIIYARGA